MAASLALATSLAVGCAPATEPFDRTQASADAVRTVLLSELSNVDEDPQMKHLFLRLLGDVTVEALVLHSVPSAILSANDSVRSPTPERHVLHKLTGARGGLVTVDLATATWEAARVTFEVHTAFSPTFAWSTRVTVDTDRTPPEIVASEVTEQA
ncbi:MAG: hypothetical protein DHS20C15_30370 [Planctomycetota bacterium]|nr:MAG: hypothetical protein DHS20C15_30370 [Planctomycetota bacterium]